MSDINIYSIILSICTSTFTNNNVLHIIAKQYITLNKVSEKIEIRFWRCFIISIKSFSFSVRTTINNYISRLIVFTDINLCCRAEWIMSDYQNIIWEGWKKWQLIFNRWALNVGLIKKRYLRLTWNYNYLNCYRNTTIKGVLMRKLCIMHAAPKY